MKLALTTLAVFLFVLFAVAQNPTSQRNKPATQKAAPKPTLEQRAIAAAKNVSAETLDPLLPDQPFAEWFQSVVGRETKVEWESNDCGEQTGDPKTTPSDFPICGQASAKISPVRTVTVMIAVGTMKKGIAGPPTLFFVGIDTENTFEDVKSLHDLPAAPGSN